MTPSDQFRVWSCKRQGWTGRGEASEEAVGMVQQEVLEPELRQEQRPWVKPEPVQMQC